MTRSFKWHQDVTNTPTFHDFVDEENDSNLFSEDFADKTKKPEGTRMDETNRDVTENPMKALQESIEYPMKPIYCK